MRYICTIILFLVGTQVYPQKIEKFSTKIDGTIVEIAFDLVDDRDGITYDLNLYSSLDNYTTPLVFVSGDIGKEVLPGVGKKIIWNARQELGEFKGEVFLELMGIISPPFIRILTPNEGDKLKLGKKVNIRWDSDITDDVQIDLYRNGSKISSIVKTSNTGDYSWTISKNLSKAEGYYLVFTSSAAPNKEIQSDHFYISKGMPVWAIVGGAVVVGGVVAIITWPEPPTGVEVEEINDPIRPDGG